MLGLFFKKYESGSDLIFTKCDTNLSQQHDSGSNIINDIPCQVTSNDLVSQVNSAAEAFTSKKCETINMNVDGTDQEKILLRKKRKKEYNARYYQKNKSKRKCIHNGSLVGNSGVSVVVQQEPSASHDVPFQFSENISFRMQLIQEIKELQLKVDRIQKFIDLSFVVSKKTK